MDAVNGLETKLNSGGVLGGGGRMMQSEEADLPRRRESGVMVTVWMRDSFCSIEGRSEAISDIVPGPFRIDGGRSDMSEK